MRYPPESFERYIVPSVFAPWAGKLVQLAVPQPGERVLDLACGTGIVARRIAPLIGASGTVMGLDFNPNMIRVARQAVQREGLSIDFRAGRAEDLPFPDIAFDLITCQFGLMLFADQPAALREMHRVLKPAGRLALSVWQDIKRHPFYQKIHEVSVRRLGISSVEPMFALADAGELRGLLAEAGFQQVQIESASLTARFPEPEELLSWELAVDQNSVPSMRDLDAASWQAVMAEIRADMQAPLDAAMQGGELVLDFHAHLAQAVRQGTP